MSAGLAALTLVSLGFVAAMAWIVPAVTGAFGPGQGLLILGALYWFGFCLPVGLWLQGRARAVEALRFGGGRAPGAIVAAQIAITGLGAALLWPDRVGFETVALAVLLGAVNGFAEEFYWRGAFLAQGRDAHGRPSLAALALGHALFTLWHWPLTLGVGVQFPGGAGAVIGGAFVWGAVWTWLTWRTGAIGWAVLGHMLTNAITFVGLIALNPI